MTIKTFRGLLGSGSQERIRLETLDGKKGYKIKYLDTIDQDPGTNSLENVLKIYSIKQTAINGTISFSDQTLLGVAYFENNTSATYGSWKQIVFDRTVFNQDIFITSNDNSGNNIGINFYLELEQISLDDVEATAVILKNFRNTNTV